MQEENKQQTPNTEDTSTEKKADVQAKPEAATPSATSQAAKSDTEKSAKSSGGNASRPNAGRRGNQGQSRGRRGPSGRGRGRRGSRSGVPAEVDYEEKNIEIARVTRVTKGGKRMRFRALMVIGNRKGRVGFGLAKSVDVAGATSKATAQARKALLSVPIQNETIPHEVLAKFAGARVLLKPAPVGTGVKAGGAVRAVLELAGIPNVVAKILGSNNKSNNVKATFVALKQLRQSKEALKSKADKEKQVSNAAEASLKSSVPAKATK